MFSYKITFHLTRPVSFIDRPVFDGLLAWCYLKDKWGYVPQKLTLNKGQLIDFSKVLPLDYHADGWAYASWMLWDKEKSAEFTGSWKKRWDNKHDHLAYFGKDRKGKLKSRLVRINAGVYKSYDMPLPLCHTKKVWFYFRSDKVEEVKRLSFLLWGIAKKSGQGKGEVDHFEIEEVDFAPFETVIRPIPATEQDIESGNLSVKFMSWKPPYWLPENHAYCIAE